MHEFYNTMLRASLRLGSFKEDEVEGEGRVCDKDREHSKPSMLVGRSNILGMLENLSAADE